MTDGEHDLGALTREVCGPFRESESVQGWLVPGVYAPSGTEARRLPLDSVRGVDACGPGAPCAECRIRHELEAAVIEHRLAVEALRVAERPYMAGLVSDGRAHDAMVKGGPRAGDS